MPSSILSADAGFPTFTSGQTTDQKIYIITNYLYMLLEQLRYSLSNIGVDNFNDAELHSITDPIYVSIEDAENGLSTQIEVTAEGIRSLVQNTESGLRSLIQQTADAINLTVTNLQGELSSLTVTVNGISTRVQDAEGNISALEQRADGFDLRVQDAEGNISSLTERADGFDTYVKGNDGRVSALEQRADGFDLWVQDTAEGRFSSLEQRADSIETWVGTADGKFSSLEQTAESFKTFISEGGPFSSLEQTVEDISTRVQDAEGNISALQETAEGFNTWVESADGRFSSLEQRATGFDTWVQDADGKFSSLEQTAESFNTFVGQGGAFSALQQKVNGFGLTVSNGQTSSTLYLSSEGTMISSAIIKMTGLVTFEGLSNGTTTINGACIKTGTIDADRLNLSESISFYDLDSSARDIINGKLTSSDLTGYATQSWVTGKGYLTSSGLSSSLSGYLRTADLAGKITSEYPYLKSTYIDGDEVTSEIIRGGVIAGAKFSDLTGRAYLTVYGGTVSSELPRLDYFVPEYSTSVPAFEVRTMYGKGYDLPQLSMLSHGQTFLYTDYRTGSGQPIVYPEGVWDFKNAMVYGI